MNAPVALRAALRAAQGQPRVAVPSLERRRLRAYLAMVAGDCAIILATFLLAGWLYLGGLPEPQSAMQAQLFLPVYLTIALYQGTYSIRALSEPRFALVRMVTAVVVAAALLNFIAFYTKSNADFSRVTFSLGMVFSIGAMAMLRLATIAVVRRQWGGRVQNMLVIEDGGAPFALPQAERVDAAAHGLDPDLRDPAMLDRVGRYLANQDRVIVSTVAGRRADWALLLKAAGVHGEVLSGGAHDLGAIGISTYDALGRSGLVVSAGPLGLRARAAKRAFDIAFASVALLVLAVPMALVALAIRLSDGGPALFVQPRMGRGNRLFSMLKFRTMRGAGDVAGARSTGRGDERVTPLGRWLRRTSVDELPQLWNVLKGEMSLVGPRPHALGSQAGDKPFWDVEAGYWQRHALRPGLTGLAQVRGLRGATDAEEDLTSRLQADLEYIAHWSLPRDLAIVARTLAVLVHDRAY